MIEAQKRHEKSKRTYTQARYGSSGGLLICIYLLCALVRFSRERRWNPRRPVYKNHVFRATAEEFEVVTEDRRTFFRSSAPLQFWMCKRVHHNKWRVRY